MNREVLSDVAEVFFFVAGLFVAFFVYPMLLLGLGG